MWQNVSDREKIIGLCNSDKQSIIKVCIGIQPHFFSTHYR